MLNRLFGNIWFRIMVMVLSFTMLWIANHVTSGWGREVFSSLALIGFGFMMFLAWFR